MRQRWATSSSTEKSATGFTWPSTDLPARLSTNNLNPYKNGENSIVSFAGLFAASPARRCPISAGLSSSDRRLHCFPARLYFVHQGLSVRPSQTPQSDRVADGKNGGGE